MKEKNKILIIGAGIIGLYTAYKLQKKGFKVVVYEKGQGIFSKPCSALISKRIKKHLPVDRHLYERQVAQILVHFPKKDIKIRVKPSYLQFDRQRLNEFIYDLAKKAGVEIVFNQEVKEIPQGFDKIIVCQGALSGLRDKLTQQKPEFRLGVQYFIKELSQNKDKDIEIWPRTFGNRQYGFLWKIPKTDSIEYGGIGATENILEELKKFLLERDIQFKQSEVKAALIPQGLCFSENKNVFLLGDAAGTTKPTTGGGVIWGFTAADILINNFSDFRVAQKKIKRFFQPKIFKGNLANNLGYFAGHHLSYLLPPNVSIDADLF